MAYNSGFDNPFGGASPTPWVKRLLIANAAVFLLLLVLGSLGDVAQRWLEFRPAALLQPPYPVWTVLTYAFVHAGLGHIFFNLLTLFFFGPPLEGHWGSRDFIRFYVVCALGGALFSLGQPYVAIVGASAAINGLMLAFAMTWPDATVHVWGIFPIKVKWLVAILAAVSVLSAAGGARDGVAHLAHLGGFVAAFALMKSPWAPRGWGDVAPSRPTKKKSLAVAWKGGKKEAPPQPARPAAPSPAVRRQERDLLDEVDRILDKIKAQGMASLTEEEKQRLHDLSRQKRTN